MRSDDAAPILELLTEVLEFCYPQSTDLERIRAIASEVRPVLDSAKDGKVPGKVQRLRQKHAIDLIHTIRRALSTNMRIRAGLPEERDEVEEPAQGSKRATSPSLSPQPSQRKKIKREPTTAGRSTTKTSKEGTNERNARVKTQQSQDTTVVHQQKRKRTSKTTKTGDMSTMREETPTQEQTERDGRKRIKREESPEERKERDAGVSLYGRQRRPRRLT